MNLDDILYQINNTAPGELLLEEAPDGLTFRKELIYTGNFVKSTKKGVQKFSVDENKISHWCDTGNQMIENGIKVPLPLKHTDEPEANRAKMLRYEADYNARGLPALFGVMRFNNPKAAELAASTDVSIYVPAEPFVDGRGNVYPYAIKHVALTDYPVIPGLSDFEPIAASYDSELELSGPMPHATRGEHLTNAGIAGAIGALEYHHAKHVAHQIGGSLGKAWKYGGVKGVGKSIGRKLVKAGVRGSLGKYAIPVALGGLAAHGAIHSGMSVIRGLHGAAKAPKKPTALSLEFDASKHPKGKDGRWSKIGRAVAATAIGGIAVNEATKGLGKPLLLKATRYASRKAGAQLAPLSKAVKTAVGLDSAEHLANAAALGYAASRVKNEPSTEVRKQSKAMHALKAVANAGGSGLLVSHGIKSVIGGIKAAHKTKQIAKIVESVARQSNGIGGRTSLSTARIAGHLGGTRPAAALAVAGAVGGLASLYAAGRAGRKANMHAKAIEASLELGDESQITIVNDPSHPNIKARNSGGKFASPGGGHASDRTMRRLRRNKGEKLYIRDDSDEDVHSHDRLTHALQAVKHASMGVIEGGLAAAAVLAAGNAAGVNITSILNAPLKGKRGAALRTRKAKAIATAFAAAAAATGLAYHRFDAIHTHLRGAAGSPKKRYVKQEDR